MVTTEPLFLVSKLTMRKLNENLDETDLDDPNTIYIKKGIIFLLYVNTNLQKAN